MRGYTAKVACLAWHPSKSLIATAGGPDIVLWEIPAKAGKAKGQPLRHHGATVTALGWSDDGSVLASADRSGQICLWDAGGQLLCVKQLGAEIAVLEWQPKQQVLLTGDTAGVVHRLSPAGQSNGPADRADAANQITDESCRSPSA
jgi:WD40 repeat protein